ncbi:PKD domain-containing protein [Flavobacterium sp. ANB]|uniref:PKD domain-containing protein n=1 Tax=unclassified Flavobacterium TaxID=196869 RepID=UPI0012B889E6|nr:MULTISPECIES: PKD domain-containing protein [unclassified Flavobacterium]MBF4517019.1 PKD domain-containing protein [Flavobacterium sp. ANB]MTD69085.1 PKD domain-containing protein [Flavobacterium sp. LC2016-13]
MKKIKLTQYITMLVALLLLIGCSSDNAASDSATKPTADFSFTSDGSTFTFTNLSTNGTKYRWDFGDLYFTSSEKNPVYTYQIGGEIRVSLTVTNDAGEEAFITKVISAPPIKIIDVKIDGDFAEWADVDITDQNTSGNGSIQLIKIWAKGANVSVYLEGNKKMQMELVDMFINTDGNTQTGFLHSSWPGGSGAEFLFEGPMVTNGWGAFYNHTDPNGGWGWAAIAGSGVNLNASGLISISDTANAMEFSIPKSQLGTLRGSIGIAITEMTAGWSAVANFPEASKFSTLKL